MSVPALGEAVDEYTPLAIVHAANPAAADRAAEAVRAAIIVGAGEPTAHPLVLEKVT